MTLFVFCVAQDKGAGMSRMTPGHERYRLRQPAVLFASIEAHKSAWVDVRLVPDRFVNRTAKALIDNAVAVRQARRVPSGVIVTTTGNATGLIAEVWLPGEDRPWWIANVEITAAEPLSHSTERRD